MSEKKQLFIDMDDTIADFSGSSLFKKNFQDQVAEAGKRRYPHEMHEPGFFRDLPVIPGAHQWVNALVNSKLYDCHILTKPLKDSSHCYFEKVQWIKAHFPALSGKIILTQDKELLAGKDRILIDDSAFKWKDPWEKKGGLFIHYDYTKAHFENGHEDLAREILNALLKFP